MRNVGVIGLGYVGINLAYLFAKGEKVIGYDIDNKKIEQYKQGIDLTGEIGININQVGITFTNDTSMISEMEYIIIAVPTPSVNGRPDTSAVRAATRLVLEHCKENVILIYASTVYPGFTRRELFPIIEGEKNFVIGENIDVAYVPERISPGDNIKIENMSKIISGTSEGCVEKINALFSSYFKNVFPVSSIEVAEAAKVLENTQRDVNIALLNEFRMIYDNVAFDEVIDAMNTKWNALGFYSGLVGGHCIAEDPYYLGYGAELKGKEYTVVKAARKLNDGFFENFVNIVEQNVSKEQKIGILGITYKPNVPDIRKSQVMCIAQALAAKGYSIEMSDPVFEKGIQEATVEGLPFIQYADFDGGKYDCIILGVTHDVIDDEVIEYALKNKIVVVDIMGTYAKNHRTHEHYYV